MRMIIKISIINLHEYASASSYKGNIAKRLQYKIYLVE